ncbi:hypothetical protein [Amycolatopsis sp. NPDC051102]|uniref:hypothetical protein n=1 Tax=Amycolatopsis sp. NPDC051102 TaxID=3155163 RepID=UPI00344301B2
MVTLASVDGGEDPLVPAYPFNEPGEDVVLYEGPLADDDGQELLGRVLLRCGSRLDVVWRLDEVPLRWEMKGLSEPEVRLRVHQASALHDVVGMRRRPAEGWVRNQSVGLDTTLLKRVLLHWMNLPAIHGPTLLHRNEGGGESWWTGRWRFEVGSWQITLDRREDHARVWEILGSEHNFAATHVMEIGRLDGAEFTATDLKPLQQALHFGMSFAFGRWVGPAAPVGIDSNGTTVWQQWAQVFCDPGRSYGLAWLHYTYTHDLLDLLSCVHSAFADPDRSDTTRFLLSMAIEVNHAGRVEQRTMTAFSALELLSWVTLKLSGELSKTQYDKLHTDGRIRRLLETAAIGAGIDSARQPTLARFAAMESNMDAPLDGPAVITKIRNRLVHPNAPQDEVYHLEGLAADTWFLTRHYLNLLILHWLGYNGSYQTVLGPGGWAGDSDPVPWAAAPIKR